MNLHVFNFLQVFYLNYLHFIKLQEEYVPFLLIYLLHLLEFQLLLLIYFQEEKLKYKIKI